MEDLPKAQFVDIRVKEGRLAATLLMPSVYLLASGEECDAAVREAFRRDIKPILLAQQGN